ncbi:aldo/keto reductase [Marinibactrum halimedae]|uniref:Oxidoreductase n=1 Tax=Marinibactrum halimedae TaxID=1444977 RepID=A0AA37T4F1_9GAMM|nr:aldo/keto reductase [Marinibactrum halimedae]MCD9457726.1 aldo/keto reductase [Marinibactrum halimedae]GLS24902.1 oxidoreductase [Marinibactrum halimedae]
MSDIQGIQRRRFLQWGLSSLGMFCAPSFSQNFTRATLMHKSIPSSGETLPVIGLGTNAYDIGPPEQMSRLSLCLSTLNELGGKFIDTAPRYGSSENVLGDMIRSLGSRKHFFLGTKCDSERRDTVISQLSQSQLNLHTDVVDIVQIHSLRGWQEQLPILREAKADGLIRYIGITTSQNNQHLELADILKNEPDIDMVQLNYSIVDRQAEYTLLPIAQEKGIAVIGNLPFDGGKLFQKIADKALPPWAAEFDCHSWAQFFLKFIISHPAVTCTIPGTTQPHHLRENIMAATGRLPSPQYRQRQANFMASL